MIAPCAHVDREGARDEGVYHVDEVVSIAAEPGGVPARRRAQCELRRSKAIKEHAVAVAKDLRSGTVSQNDLLQRLANDSRLGLNNQALDALVQQGRANAGDAPQQVDHFCEVVAALAKQHPDAANYQPGVIL